jgi:translin
MAAIDNLDAISERIRESFDSKSQARDRALARSRELIRYCAKSIRAIHREEFDTALELMRTAGDAADALRDDVKDYPDLYFAGYTQDALKEFVEANTTYALIRGNPLPEPEELNVEYNTYLKGLAEAIGELRRHTVDRIRLGQIDEGNRLLGIMDEVYDIMVTMDYPDAITAGLRRITDMVRGVTERTRGDLTVATRQEKLETALRQFEKRVDATAAGNVEK